MLRRLLASLLIVALLAPATVFADPARAQEFYNQAALAYEKGEYKTAADLLYQAYAEDANLIYVYNRILALQADKQFESALKELEVFELRMKDDPEKRFEDVPQIKAQLQEQVKQNVTVVPPKEDPKKDDPKTDKPDEQKEPIEDPGVVEESGGGPGVLPIVLLATGGVVLGTGALMSTGVFFSDQSKLDESNDVINRFNTNAITPGIHTNKNCEVCGVALSTKRNNPTETRKAREAIRPRCRLS